MGAQGKHVAVIGAGIVGVCTALELQDRGCKVTVIEPGVPGGEQAASFGNGAFLSTHSFMPMSFPGLWKKVPGYLLDRNGPLVIDWRQFPRLLPWLIRFMAAGFTQERVRKIAKPLSELLKDSPILHAAMAESAGVPELILREGIMFCFPTRKDYEAEAFGWNLRREYGVAFEELDRAGIVAREPDISEAYQFGVWIPSGGRCANPGGYVAALAQRVQSRGGEVLRAKATGMRMNGQKLLGVETSIGFIPCDQAVVTAGIGSGKLTKILGDRIPLEAERGYHIQVEMAHNAPGLRTSMMPSDGKMANSRLAGGLRAAGQVELSHVDAPPNWHRTDILMGHLKRTFKNLPEDMKVSRWQGSRPSTPDGLPVIGPSRGSGDVFYAFGHGHVGLSAGPKTAQIVAALICGEVPPQDPAPFAATRF